MTDGLTFRRGGWRYLVPNALTALNLGFGTMSCFYSVYGNAYLAGWFILLSVCFDRFDGAAARALRATGKFGLEFDSLADLISFGLAPALMIFAALVKDPAFAYSSPGWQRALLFGSSGYYVLATAFRLARFNVYAEDEGTKVYFGLPSPAAAATVTVTYLVLLKYSGSQLLYPGWGMDGMLLGGGAFGQPLRAYMPWVVLFAGTLMVTGLKVPKLRMGRGPASLYVAINMVFVYFCVLLRVYPEYLFFVVIQMLIVATTFSTFWRSAHEVAKQALFDTMSVKADGVLPTGPAESSHGREGSDDDE